MNDARIGAVELNVRDLDRAVGFYQGILRFRVHRRSATLAELGTDEVLLRLHHAPDAPARAPRQAGLYHVAYLVPTRGDLGRLIRHLVDLRAPLQGASDHSVSEALYLADPEGNGIEVYADRPRETWPRLADRIAMGTAPMDVRAVVASGGDGAWTQAPDAMRVGHVHLQVSDVPSAERFYRERVGFDVQAQLGTSASFLSAGGYHHHVAVNAWGTQGGPHADPHALGLRRFEVLVPADAYEPTVKRLGGDEVADPAGNVLRVTRTPAAGSDDFDQVANTPIRQ